jgi:hypothetical protein
MVDAVRQRDRLRGSPDHQRAERRHRIEDARQEAEGFLRLPNGGAEDRQHRAFSRRKPVDMIAQRRDIGGQDGHGSGLAASAANDRPQLVDPLSRFPMPSCEGFKDDALKLREGLAHGGDKQDPPRRPAFSGEDPAKQVRVAQCGPH